MLLIQIFILIFISITSSKSYIFSTNEDKSTSNDEAKKYNTENGGGWFGTYTRNTNEVTNKEVIDNEDTGGWLQSFSGSKDKDIDDNINELEKKGRWYLPFYRQETDNENTENKAGWFRPYSRNNDENKNTESKEKEHSGGWFQPFSYSNEQNRNKGSDVKGNKGVSGWFGSALDKTNEPLKNTETEETRAGWLGPFYSQNQAIKTKDSGRWFEAFYKTNEKNKIIEPKADVNGWFGPFYGQNKGNINTEIKGNKSFGGWFAPFYRHKNQEKSDDIKENENTGGWIELFSKQKNENKTIEITKIENVPVISIEWMEKYKEMVEELAKFDKVFKESKLPADLLVKYNTSLHQLKEVENRLEDRYEIEEVTQSKPTTQTLNKEKEQYMSYAWYDKYSEAIAKLVEVKTYLDDSLTKEIIEVTNTLDDLRKSWELFSFYNIWKEQYKRLASYWLSLNKSLGGMRDASDADNWTGERILDTLRNTSALGGWADSSVLGSSIIGALRNTSVINNWKNRNFLDSFRNTSFLENWNNRSALGSLLSSVVFDSMGNKSVLASWKSSLPDVWSYKDMVTQYLPTIGTPEPVCSSKVLTCPDNKQTFTADACCSPLWLSIGAPLGLGNECWVDLDKMADQCNIFSCYGNTDNGTYSTDGCTYIPDIMLNYESCVIHDLCYVTPGVTKEDCDEVMRDNINKIYCHNVNRYERKLCSVRASLAATALRWTDRYFEAAGLERDTCQLADSWIKTIWKYSFNKVFRPIF